jgi:hypothetical protein
VNEIFEYLTRLEPAIPTGLLTYLAYKLLGPWAEGWGQERRRRQDERYARRRTRTRRPP